MTYNWLIERDVFSEENFEKFLHTFKKFKIPYKVVTVTPFSHEILEKVNYSNPFVVYGSMGIQDVAEGKKLTPGVWSTDQFSYSYFASKIPGKALNEHFVVQKFKNICIDVFPDEFFIKPDSDQKEFAGLVMTKTEYPIWKKRLLDSGYISNDDFNVITSSVKEISNEYRIVVVNDKISSYSQYKENGKKKLGYNLPDGVRDFALKCIKIFRPQDVYVIDIGQTSEGLKVIEYNTFNNAGLYNCNIEDVVRDITEFLNG